MTLEEFLEALEKSDPGCYISDEGGSVIIDGWFEKDLIEKALRGEA